MCKQCKELGRLRGKGSIHEERTKQEEIPHQPNSAIRKRNKLKVKKWKICCRTCGKFLGFVESADKYSEEHRDKVQRQLHLPEGRWPICDGCRRKRDEARRAR